MEESSSRAFDPSAKTRLTHYDRGRFPSDRLFDRLGRAVCAPGCLPRKELYEAWELARRVRRRFRGGRVVDVGGGHGLLAHVMLLLDGSSSAAVVVDPALPPSGVAIDAAIAAVWPRHAGRVQRVPDSIDAFAIAPGDVVVSSHACGDLSDRVLDAAMAARVRVAVLPCCHDIETCDAGSLAGWLDASLAIDVQRAWRLEQANFRVWTQTIPASITAKNRLLFGEPHEAVR